MSLLRHVKEHTDTENKSWFTPRSTHIAALHATSQELDEYYSRLGRPCPHQATRVEYQVIWDLRGVSRFWNVVYHCEPGRNSKNGDELSHFLGVNDDTGQVYVFPPLSDRIDFVDSKLSDAHESASIQALKNKIESCTCYPNGLVFAPRMTPVDALLAALNEAEQTPSEEQECACAAKSVEFHAVWDLDGHSISWQVNFEYPEADDRIDPDLSTFWYIVDDETGHSYPFPMI